MSTVRPFFVLRASIGAPAFTSTLRRREEDVPGTTSPNCVEEWRLSEMCMDAAESMGAVDGGAHNCRKHAFRLRFDLICTCR
jgi:hypothetical protein